MRRLILSAALVMLAGCGSATVKTVIRTTAVISSTATSSVTSSAITLPPPLVYFKGAVGAAALRPKSLELTADGTLSVERVQWSAWGGPSARGTGNALYHGCTPNCAAAQTHAAVVSIVLSNIRTCGGKQYYAGVTLRLNSGRLLDRSFLQRSWSPC